MATFVFKVFTLAIRTASKPLASRFQTYVLDHPTLRPQVLKFAQGLHAVDVAMTRISEGKLILGKQTFVGKLDDDRAIDLAGKFVSEGFVLGVGVAVLYWDYRRGAAKDAGKAEKDAAYRASVEKKFEQQKLEHQQDKSSLEGLMRAMQERMNSVDTILKDIRAQQDKKNSKWFLFS